MLIIGTGDVIDIVRNAINIMRDTTDKYSTRSLALQKELNVVEEEISAIVQKDNYVELKNILQRYVYEADKLQDGLREALTKVTELEAIQVQREQYSEKWWQEEARPKLHKAFENPEQGFHQWLQIYTRALIAWELATCKKLVSEPFHFPDQATTALTHLRRGIQAIEDENHFQALGMLDYLFQSTSSETSQPFLDEVSRAVLLVFEGRIYLYKASENQTTLKLFEQARKLAPNDGLPYAALGSYYQAQGDSRQARSLYQRAIELSLSRPDGYIGLGLLSEARAAWDEAADWYEEAIEAVQEEKNVEVALSKLLAPVSGNIYLQLARMLKKKDPEHALQAVERAISVGIKHDGQYPEHLGYRLKGEILENLAWGAEAAEAFLEAGRRFIWRNEPRTAVELFTHALSLDKENVNTYWELTDAQRLASYRTVPPYVDEGYIRGSMDTLERGMKLEQTADNLAWTYNERALISEQLARLPDADRWARWWEAITYLERALLLNETDPYFWAFLGRYHRLLETNESALQATSKALEYDPNSLAALDERAAILANVGKFDTDEGAEAVINKRQALEKNVWVDGVKVYVLFHVGQYKKALQLAKSVVDTQPNDIWSRSLLARCYSYLDDLPHATEQFEWIWQRYQEENADDRSTFGEAAYNLNKFNEAISIYGKILKEGIALGEAYWGLGICHLALGDVQQGEELAGESIKQVKNERQLEDMRKETLQSAKKSSTSWPHHAQAREALDRIEQEINKRKRQMQLEPAPTVEAELKQVVAEHPLEEGKVNWAWIGAHAGLARFYTEEKQWSEAVAAYQLLQKEGEHFSEAHYGLEKIFDELLADGDARLKEGKSREALEQFTQMQELKLLLGDATRQAGLCSRLGYIHFDLTDIERAHSCFTQAIQLYRESNTPCPGTTLGDTCRSVLPDATHYWNLDADWKTWTDDPAMDDALHSDLAAARKSLADYLDGLYQLSGQYPDASKWSPLVEPIGLEVGLKLLPGGLSDKWPLITSYIPQMRRRLKDSMGITIPGVNIRDNLTLEPNEYILLLDEIPLARDRVPLDMRYSPASSQALQAFEIPAEALIEVPHPLTGEPGC